MDCISDWMTHIQIAAALVSLHKNSLLVCAFDRTFLIESNFIFIAQLHIKTVEKIAKYSRKAAAYSSKIAKAFCRALQSENRHKQASKVRKRMKRPDLDGSFEWTELDLTPE